MNRIIEKAMAIIRGCVFKFFSMLNSKMYVQSVILKYSNVKIRVRREGKIFLDKNISVNEGTIISALNGGEIKIGKGVSFGVRNIIVSHENVSIGDNTIFGPNVLIYDHDHVFSSKDGVHKQEYVTSPVVIGKNSWIGANVIILKGSVIGDNCVVAAGSVVKGVYDKGTVILQKRETASYYSGGRI